MAKNKALGVQMPSETDWQARMDCDTLMQAEQIESDAKRYKAAKAEAKRRLSALNDVFAEDETQEKATDKKSGG